jgi:hypothetical protein
MAGGWWLMAGGWWLVAHGLWLMACGSWLVGDGLWVMANSSNLALVGPSGTNFLTNHTSGILSPIFCSGVRSEELFPQIYVNCAFPKVWKM